MKLRMLVALAACWVVASCAAGTPSIIDTELDQNFYQADTKAERLIRYFELQAIIIRVVANSGGSVADRNSIALANIGANDELTKLAACLRFGSVNSISDPETGELKATTYNNLRAARPDELVRTENSYCSFFESRVISYQESILNMLVLAAKNDPDVKIVAGIVQGNILNFGSVLANLFQVVGRAVQDAAILHALQDDALELRYFIYRNSYGSPESVPAACANAVATNCGPLDDSIPDGQATIRVWHFQEVEAYMKAACEALNGDAPSVKSNGANTDNTNCSANMPYALPSDADFRGVGKASSLANLGNKPKQKPPSTQPAGHAVSDAEHTLFARELRTIQGAFCLPKDGDLGKLMPQSKTRSEIDQYFIGRGLSIADPKDGLTSRNVAYLLEATAVQDCKITGFKNAFEVGVFGVSTTKSNDQSTQDIKDFQTRIKNLTSNSQSFGREFGVFGQLTRDLIRIYSKNVDLYVSDGALSAALYQCVAQSLKSKCPG